MAIRKFNLPGKFNNENKPDNSDGGVQQAPIQEPLNVDDQNTPLPNLRRVNISGITKEPENNIKTPPIKEDSENSLKEMVKSLIEVKRVSSKPKANLNVRKIEKSKLGKREPAQPKLVRISNLNLEDLVEKAKNIHTLPRERQMKISPTHRNWMLAQLRKASSESKLHDFAFSLKHKELSLIFPVLATTRNPLVKEKLKTVIRLRASQTLYFHGWITWQFIYPDNRLAKQIADLCEILSEQKLPGQQYHKDLIINHDEEISDLPYPHFNWPEIKLISDIILPDNRRFMSTITNHLLENNISLNEFFSKYAIYDDLALGEAITANYKVEKIEHNFKVQKPPKEGFSWHDFLGLNDNSDFSEELE